MSGEQCVKGYCTSSNLAASCRGGLPPEASSPIFSNTGPEDNNATQQPSATESQGAPQSVKGNALHLHGAQVCTAKTAGDAGHDGSTDPSFASQRTAEPVVPAIYDTTPYVFHRLEASDLQYAHYLEGLRGIVPGVSDLVDIIEASCMASQDRVPRNEHHYIPGEHIVVGEILRKTSRSVRWHDIDTANTRSLQEHSDILSGRGDSENVAFRYLVMDDMSGRAIEVLGSKIGIDPRVFTKHLHQSINGHSIETMSESINSISRKHVSPEPYLYNELKPLSIFRLGQDLTSADGQMYQVTCPTDIHLVPASEKEVRMKILDHRYEELQMKRFPHDDQGRYRELFEKLSRHSFMTPSISEDVGPYLPSYGFVGPLNSNFVHHTRVNLERLDTVTLYVIPNTEIPTVLVLRPPSLWNHGLAGSSLEYFHLGVSDKSIRWHCLPTKDPLQLSAIETAADLVPCALRQRPQETSSVKETTRFYLYETGYPNMQLCKVITDLHESLTEQLHDQPLNRSVVAQIFLLERSTSCLHDRASEDHKRVYTHCANDRLEPEEKRRLLDYCRTRTMRTKQYHGQNREMLQTLVKHCESEPEGLRRRIQQILGQLVASSQQLEDRICQTQAFVDLQLSHITHEQQAFLMHNQIALSEIQIQESRKAIEQTETVRKLTMLAFVFIPTSTICSFFGMNIRELDSHPGIWIFILTLLVVLATTLTIAAAGYLFTLLMRLFAVLPIVGDQSSSWDSRLYKPLAKFLLLVLHVPFALAYKIWHYVAHRSTILKAQGEEFHEGYQHYDSPRKESNELSESVWRERGVIAGYRANKAIGIIKDAALGRSDS